MEEEKNLNNKYTIECALYDDSTIEDKQRTFIVDKKRTFIVNSEGVFRLNILYTLLEERMQFIISAYDQVSPLTGCQIINGHGTNIMHRIIIPFPDKTPINPCSTRDTRRCLQNRIADLSYIDCDLSTRDHCYMLILQLDILKYEEFLKQQEAIKKVEAERIEKQLAKYDKIGDRIGDRIADRLIAKYERLIKENKGN